MSRPAGVCVYLKVLMCVHVDVCVDMQGMGVWGCGYVCGMWMSGCI